MKKNPQPGSGAEGSKDAGSKEHANHSPDTSAREITFSAYVLGDFEPRWGWVNDVLGTGYGPAKDDHEFRKRLANANIVGLNGLLRWARERYPDFYYKTHVWNGGGTGQKLMRRVWADYLLWAGR